MKKLRYSLLITFIIISLALLDVGNNETVRYLDALAKIAATGGLLALLYQYVRERNLNEADFILRLNNSFITNRDISRIYKLLEGSKMNEQKDNPFTEEDTIDLANYLSFFEPIYGLIQRKIIDIQSLDSVLSYRFFLAVNNRFVQRMVLCLDDKKSAWESVHKLYDYWKAHREKNHLEVWMLKHDLAEHPAHQNIV